MVDINFPPIVSELIVYENELPFKITNEKKVVKYMQVNRIRKLTIRCEKKIVVIENIDGKELKFKAQLPVNSKDFKCYYGSCENE